MAFSDFLIDGLSRSRERFDRALSGVTVKQANTQPTPKKAPRVDSLSWLAWHTAREIDFQIAPLAGVEPVWITGRHKERFALDLPDDTEDWRHTPEQAAKVVVGDISVLTAYLDDAYAMAAGYLRAVGEGGGDGGVDEARRRLLGGRGRQYLRHAGVRGRSEAPAAPESRQEGAHQADVERILNEDPFYVAEVIQARLIREWNPVIGVLA